MSTGLRRREKCSTMPFITERVSAKAWELRNENFTQAEALRQMFFHLYIHQIQKRLNLQHKEEIHTINLRKYKWDTEHYLKTRKRNVSALFSAYLTTTLYTYTKVHLYNRTTAHHPKRGVFCPWQWKKRQKGKAASWYTTTETVINTYPSIIR